MKDANGHDIRIGDEVQGYDGGGNMPLWRSHYWHTVIGFGRKYVQVTDAEYTYTLDPRHIHHHYRQGRPVADMGES